MLSKPAKARPGGSLAAIYQGLAHALLENMSWRRCRFCGTWFSRDRNRKDFRHSECQRKRHNTVRCWKRWKWNPWPELADRLLQLFDPLLPRTKPDQRRCLQCFGELHGGQRKFCRRSCAVAYRQARRRRVRPERKVSLPDARHPIAVLGDKRYMTLNGRPLPPPTEMRWFGKPLPEETSQAQKRRA